MQNSLTQLWILVLMVFVAGNSYSQLESLPAATEMNLADAIQKPIAALISWPFQNNTDFGLEPAILIIYVHDQFINSDQC